MRFGQLEIPEAVITAQEEGKLVLFVGAGASIPPPANLPDFKELVRIVCGDKSILEDKPLDQVLASYREKGMDVHGKVQSLIKERMGQDGAGPSELHKQIPRLFLDTKDNPVRLVTTNYDTYLAQTTPDSLQKNAAPALPLGKGFEGLVYLHGSVTHGRAQSLVLTDIDFSKAYMADGWACKFLMNLYEEFTVLFIGYSHNDDLVTFLARGVEFKENSVFAFSGNDEESLKKWKHLSISPILYPDGKHDVLLDGIARWADETQSDFFSRRRKFIGILKDGIPCSDSEEDGFLKKYVLAHGYTKEFIIYADSREWVEWVIANEFTDFIHKEVPDDLFSPFMPWKDRDDWRILGSWLANWFVVDIPLLQLALKRHQGDLSWPLSISLIHALERCKKVVPDAFVQIVILLMHHCSNIKIQGEHTVLLELSLQLGEYGAALVVLRELLRPKSSMDLYIATGSESSIAWRGIEYNFTPSMLIQYCIDEGAEFRETYAWQIASICTDSLNSTVALTKAIPVGEPNPWVSVRSVKRSIDSGGSYKEVIANLAVECLELMVQNRKLSSMDYVKLITKSESSIVRRIGVHLFDTDDGIASATKLDWLQTSGLLFSYPEYHEVFSLMKNALNDCDEIERKTFLQILKKKFERESLKGNAACSWLSDYCFHLGFWLSDQIADSNSVDEYAKWCSSKFDFLFVRESPEWPAADPNIPTGESFSLSQKTESEIISLVDSLDGKEKLDTVLGFYNELKESPQKALKMLQAIHNSEREPDIDLVAWVTGFLAFKARCSGEQYISFLELVSFDPFRVPFHVHLILAIYQRPYKDSISDEALRLEFRVTEAFWLAITQGEYVPSMFELFDVETALSFLTWVLSRILKEAGNTDLQHDVMELIETISRNDYEFVLPAIRGIGKSFFVLYNKMPEWAAKHVSDLFSPSHGSRLKAKQAWRGFFGIVNERREEMELLRESLIESLNSNIVPDPNFNCTQMIFSCLMCKYDNGLAEAYIGAMDDKSLSSFIVNLRFSKQLKNDFFHYWVKWVRKYIEGRLEGIVKFVSKMEYAEILLFAVENKQIYSDLKSLLKMYSGEVWFVAGQFVKSSLESGFHERYPIEAARYLKRLVNLESMKNYRNAKSILEYANLLIQTDEETKPFLLPVLEILGECGVVGTEKIHEALNGGINPN